MYRLSGFLTFLLVSSSISYKLEDNFKRTREDYSKSQNYIDSLYMNDVYENPKIVRDTGESNEESENSIDGNVDTPMAYIAQDQFIQIPLGIPEEEKNVPGEHLTPDDFANAKKIEILAPVMDENSPDPIQAAGLFEGDIAGINISDVSVNPDGRNAIRDMNQRWNDGVIPYVISAAFNMYERSVIAAAFMDYQQNTCIRFVPRTTQRDYVYLLKGSGCSSQVGRVGSGQQISLGPGCIYKGVIIHELMHAVGFWHEQSRTDRDNYVTVLWRNIIPGMEFNFNKYNWNMIQTLGVPYDTSSVMHYTRMSFSRDGRSPTIIPKNPGVDFIGQRTGFSKSDIMKINRLYQCSDMPTKIDLNKPFKGCVDSHRHCAYWSSIGECMKNPAWMLPNCRKSCKQCRPNSPGEFTDGQHGGEAVSNGCRDYNKNCEYWQTIGECAKNQNYMSVYCAKSCNTCNTTSDCVDEKKMCQVWAKEKECEANPDYMLKYCRRSCKQC